MPGCCSTSTARPTDRRPSIPLELLERVGLGTLPRRRPHELSGGMQQRVALVRALALGAPLLAMDEPLAALDEITRAEMRGLLNQLVEGRRRDDDVRHPLDRRGRGPQRPGPGHLPSAGVESSPTSMIDLSRPRVRRRRGRPGFFELVLASPPLRCCTERTREPNAACSRRSSGWSLFFGAWEVLVRALRHPAIRPGDAEPTSSRYLAGSPTTTFGRTDHAQARCTRLRHRRRSSRWSSARRWPPRASSSKRRSRC